MSVLCCSFFRALNCVLGAMRPFCSVATVSRPYAPIFTWPIQVLSTMPHISPTTVHTTPSNLLPPLALCPLLFALCALIALGLYFALVPPDTQIEGIPIIIAVIGKGFYGTGRLCINLFTIIRGWEQEGRGEEGEGKLAIVRFGARTGLFIALSSTILAVLVTVIFGGIALCVLAICAFSVVFSPIPMFLFSNSMLISKILT